MSGTLLKVLRPFDPVQRYTIAGYEIAEALHRALRYHVLPMRTVLRHYMPQTSFDCHFDSFLSYIPFQDKEQETMRT